MPSAFTAKSDGTVPAGQLRRRLTIQQRADTSDGAGGYTTVWNTLIVVFGALTPWKPYAQAIGQMPQEQMWVRYAIRHPRSSASIVSGMRLVDADSTGTGGTTYTIIAAFDPDGTQRQMHLTCQQVAPGTA